MKRIFKIIFFISFSTTALVAQGKSFSHPSNPTLFTTDFGTEIQQISFKNLSLCGKYFHYKIFDHQGMKWEKMTKDSRPHSHYLIEGRESKFHIVFINFDEKTSKLYFTIGKPPMYKHTGAVVLKPEVDKEYLDDFYISSAYALSMSSNQYSGNQYMVVFFNFMVPDNTYLESNVLLLCETEDEKLSYSILPGKQLSTSPYCLVDYNHDGWLDYVHFNPFAYPEPMVSFYDGYKTKFKRNADYYGTVSFTEDYLYELDMSKSKFP